MHTVIQVHIYAHGYTFTDTDQCHILFILPPGKLQQIHAYEYMNVWFLLYDLLTLTNVTVCARPSLVTPADKRAIAIGTCAVYTGYRV